MTDKPEEFAHVIPSIDSAVEELWIGGKIITWTRDRVEIEKMRVHINAAFRARVNPLVEGLEDAFNVISFAVACIEGRERDYAGKLEPMLKGALVNSRKALESFKNGL